MEKPQYSHRIGKSQCVSPSHLVKPKQKKEQFKIPGKLYQVYYSIRLLVSVLFIRVCERNDYPALHPHTHIHTSAQLSC